MITIILFIIKSIDQDAYDKIIETLDLTKITCKCKQAHFVRHGSYERDVCFADLAFRLKVQRVKCKSCGHTHGIMPELIVPYQRLSADVQRIVIQCPLGSAEVEKLMHSNPEIDIPKVLAARKRYHDNWKERVRTMGMDLCSSIWDLINSSFSWFGKQFLQIWRGTNLKFCPSTFPKYTAET